MYLKAKDLYNEVMISKSQNKPTIKLIKMFSLLIKKIGLKFYYPYPEDRQDAESNSMMRLYLYWNNFDPTKSNNPFPYYTEIIKRAYAESYHQTKREGNLDIQEMTNL